ncbi:MAG: hypothetical protein WBN80_11380 [Prochlorococcaceae cyanobacterium]
MARVHVAPRSCLQWPDSRYLVELSDCCCLRSLRRLAEVVDKELCERQDAQPARPMEPAVMRKLPC